jgi:hypothetical protein
MISSLFVIWSLSLMVVVAITGFAYSRMRYNKFTVAGIPPPSQFVEFFGDQFHDICAHVLKALHYAKPHVAQAGVIALSFGKRGHDVFVERVFGRTEFKRGSAGSFFLKHLAEQRGNTQRGQRDSTLLH